LSKRHKTVSEKQNQLFILVIFLPFEKSLEIYFHSAKQYCRARASIFIFRLRSFNLLSLHLSLAIQKTKGKINLAIY